MGDALVVALDVVVVVIRVMMDVKADVRAAVKADAMVKDVKVIVARHVDPMGVHRHVPLTVHHHVRQDVRTHVIHHAKIRAKETVPAAPAVHRRVNPSAWVLVVISVHQHVQDVQILAQEHVLDVLINVPMHVHQDAMAALQHASDSVRTHVVKVALVNVHHVVVRAIRYVVLARVHARRHVCSCVPTDVITSAWIPVVVHVWKNA